MEVMNIGTQDLKNEAVRYLLRNDVTGGRNVTVDTVVDLGRFEPHEQGAAKEAIRELIRNPPPVQAYGGQRDAVQLTSLPDGAQYLKNNDGELPFGWE